MTKVSEARMQQNCFLWHWNSFPAQRGRLWMNYNNAKNKAHGAILKGMGLLAGVSDMTFLRSDGRAVFIELKTGTKQSKKQKDWEKVVTECNAFYELVVSEDQFKEVIVKHA